MDERELEKRISAMQVVLKDQIGSLCRIVGEWDDLRDSRALQLLEILLTHGGRLARELQLCVDARASLKST
jgi:hypothetical protein